MIIHVAVREYACARSLHASTMYLVKVHLVVMHNTESAIPVVTESQRYVQPASSLLSL